MTPADLAGRVEELEHEVAHLRDVVEHLDRVQYAFQERLGAVADWVADLSAGAA